MWFKKCVLSLASLVFIVGATGCTITNSKSPISISGEEYSIDETKKGAMNEINTIEIYNTSGTITIIPQDRKDIEAHLYGKVSTSTSQAKPELNLEISNGKLMISSERKVKTIVGFYSSNMNLDIYVPKTYNEFLSINSSSGDINIKDLKLKECNFELSSGSTTINNLNVERLNYKASSGDLEGKNLITKDSKIQLSSGEVDIEGFIGNLEGESTSGDVAIAYETFNNKVDYKASSGRITLNLPKDAEFFLDAEVSSGNIKCDFPVTVQGERHEDILRGIVKSDKNKITVKTSSGDIKIGSR